MPDIYSTFFLSKLGKRVMKMETVIVRLVTIALSLTELKNQYQNIAPNLSELKSSLSPTTNPLLEPMQYHHVQMNELEGLK